VTFEFRATKWNVVVPSPSSLQDLGAALWDLQQHLNPSYPLGTDGSSDPLNGGHPHENVNRTGSASSSTSLSGGGGGGGGGGSFSSSSSTSALPRRMLALPPSFPDELNILQRLLPFPEEVALKLTETEYELFNSVPPIDYLRYCTTDLTAARQASASGHNPPQQQQQSANAQPAENGVPSLIRRFNEVCWLKQSLLSFIYFFLGLLCLCVCACFFYGPHPSSKTRAGLFYFFLCFSTFH
jgi:hypothetical protein